MRSTLSANLVNEVLFGWQSSPNDFFGNSSPDMFTNQNGYFLNFGFPVSPDDSTITNPAPGNSNSPQPRNTPNFNIDNNLNWLKGSHSFKFGGSFTRISNTITNWTTVQQVNLGFNTTNDPAAGLFNTTNFPGASTNDLNNARSLYAMLTGRVASINGTGRMNEEGTEYIYNGRLTQAERMDEFGFYASDSWRVKPNMTLTLGVRYELQLPMVPTKSTRTIASLESLCGPSGSRRRRRRPAVQPVQSRRVQRARHADHLRAVLGGGERLQHRPEQLRAERRDYLPANGHGRLLAQLPRRSGSGGAERRLHAVVQSRARRPVHGRLRRQPGLDHPGHAQHAGHRLPAGPAGRVVAAALQSNGPAGSAELPEDPDVPNHRGDQQQRPDLRREHPDSVHGFVERRLPTRTHDEHRG